MLQRIINWITSPFKKKEEKVKAFTLPAITPLSEEQKNQIKADLIQAIKEFKEKKDYDVLPTSRISTDAKEKITKIMKEDINTQIETHPFTEEVVNVFHDVVITEEAPKKKKRYYKKKNKGSNK